MVYPLFCRQSQKQSKFSDLRNFWCSDIADLCVCVYVCVIVCSTTGWRTSQQVWLSSGVDVWCCAVSIRLCHLNTVSKHWRHDADVWHHWRYDEHAMQCWYWISVSLCNDNVRPPSFCPVGIVQKDGWRTYIVSKLLRVSSKIFTTFSLFGTWLVSWAKTTTFTFHGTAYCRLVCEEPVSQHW